MGVLLVSFFVVLGFSNGLGYFLDADPGCIAWPEQYHMKAEKINMMSGVVEPVEIWYNAELNKSRVDCYDGAVKRYYYGLGEDHYDEDGVNDTVLTLIYMVHPVYSQENGNSTQQCSVDIDTVDSLDHLPSLIDYKYESTYLLNGREVQLWKKVDLECNLMRNEEELVLYEEGGVVIPIRHTQKQFLIDDGSLRKHIIVNYYSYDKNVGIEDLEVPDENACDYLAYNFYDAIQFLHPMIPSDVRSAFKKYKTHHKRMYSDREHNMRMNIFLNNWEFINEYNSKNLGYVLQINEFADKTDDELNYLTGVHSDNRPTKSHNKHDRPIKSHKKSDKPIKTHKRSDGLPIRDVSKGPIREDPLPENFDLRMLGVISPVRHQAHCGSCWAFSAASTLEGVIARSNGGRILDLSEQSLVDCAWDYDSAGCGGTMSIEAVFRYLKTYGIPTVEEYGPYLAEDGYCNIKNMTRVYKSSGYKEVPSDATALKTAIYKHGPVTVGMYATKALKFYKSGIFHDPTCKHDRINHAVTVIGYGHKDGELFWIIKNSWGETWGNAGYLYITAKDNNCNVLDMPYYPTLDDEFII